MNHACESAEMHALGLLEPGERLNFERHLAGCPECLRRAGVAEESAASLVAVLPRVEPSVDLLQRLSDVPRFFATSRPTLPEAPLGLGFGDEFGGRAQRMADRWAHERSRSARLQVRATTAALALVVLIVGLAFSLSRNAESDALLRGDQLALTLMAKGPFNQLKLIPASDLAPKAKLLYAQDGSWLYLLVEGKAAGLRAEATADPAAAAGPTAATGSAAATATGPARDLGAVRQRGETATLFVRDPGKLAHISLRDASGVVAGADLTY